MAVLSRPVRHVFINFRGKDLRHGFVSHLTEALERHNINFFIDSNERKGRDLKDLFKRIGEATVALVILSTRFAESKWCLEELRAIVEQAEKGEMVVIPIFYKVGAEDVRRQKGEFGKWFSKGIQEIQESSPQEMEKWQKALKAVSNKIGFKLDHNSSEAKLIKKVVKELLTDIPSDEGKEDDSVIVKKTHNLPLALPWVWFGSAVALIVAVLLALGIIALLALGIIAETFHKCASPAMVVLARRAIPKRWTARLKSSTRVPALRKGLIKHTRLVCSTLIFEYTVEASQ